MEYFLAVITAIHYEHDQLPDVRPYLISNSGDGDAAYRRRSNLLRVNDQRSIEEFAALESDLAIKSE